MIRFIAIRLLQTIPVIWVIITATFFMIRFVPGGPFTAERAVTPEIMRNLEAHYGLNKPLYRQYLDYCCSVLRGDLGPSFKYPTRSVNEIIAEKLPVSIELGLWSLGVALCHRACRLASSPPSGATHGSTTSAPPRRWWGSASRPSSWGRS